MFKAVNVFSGRGNNLDHGKLIIFLFLMIFLCFSTAIAQDLTVNIRGITVDPAESSFEIPIYISDLSAVVASFQLYVNIDGIHLINFASSDLIVESADFLDNWTLSAFQFGTPAIVKVIAGTNNSEEYLQPFSGERLLVTLRGVLASSDSNAVCDSSGVIFMWVGESNFFGPEGEILALDLNSGAYYIDCSACGDANLDDAINVSDAVYIINYVFTGGYLPADKHNGDVNCDGTCNVSDAVYLINFVFVGGNAPCDSDGDNVPDC